MNPENPYFGAAERPQYPAPHQPHHYPPAQHQMPPQPEHYEHTPLPPLKEILPTPVVKVLSPFGVAYVFLTFALLMGGASIIGILLLLVNGVAGFAALAFPAAVLTVTLPIFAGLFLYLKKMELKMPALKLDASKRRSTQFTQIIAFLTCVFTLIGFVTIAFGAMGGLNSVSVGKAALNTLCIVVVAGGILSYYWRDEHVVKR